MVFLRFTALFLFIGIPSFSQFLGGSADGGDNFRLSNVVCTVTNTSPFLGGNADGHANLRLSNVVCAVINTNPFLGGDADGHANLRLSNVVCAVINTNPFLGGDADGHSNFRFVNTACPAINTNPYLGGTADGSGREEFRNVTRMDCKSIVLPIELLSFNAFLANKKVELEWVTAAEINNDYFTIEKTSSFNLIELVGRVDAIGNSTVLSYYTLVDPSPYYGLSYYRLKQTDFDGTFSYSDWAPIYYLKEKELSVHPTLVSADRKAIEIVNLENFVSPLSVEVRNAHGSVVKTVNIYDYDNTYKLSVEWITAGVYFINITVDAQLYSFKLVVVK